VSSEPDFDPLDFEIDFCLALAMMEGKSYQAAKTQAVQWVKESRVEQENESSKSCNRSSISCCIQPETAAKKPLA
jgi:hypothetical protein